MPGTDAIRKHYFCEASKSPSEASKALNAPAKAASSASKGDSSSSTALTVPNSFFYTEKRFEELSKALTRINSRVMYLQYQLRIHQEFDREIEWLNYALKLYRAKIVERKDDFLAKNDKYKIKRRSLRALMHTVHNETPTIEVLHRTFEEPFLKIRCLADMKYKHSPPDRPRHSNRSGPCSARPKATSNHSKTWAERDSKTCSCCVGPGAAPEQCVSGSGRRSLGTASSQF